MICIASKMDIKESELRNVESEAGILATVLLNPEYTFYSEMLKPNHFSDEQNAYIYYAVSELARRGVNKVDSYNIINILNSKAATKAWASQLTPAAITELIDLSRTIARSTKEEYLILVDNVLGQAFRRETLQKLKECQQLCVNQNVEDIQGTIYKEIESLVCQYRNLDDIKPMGDKIDEIWSKVKKGQSEDNFIDFKFPSLNHYCKLSRTDLIIFAAREKRGKSIMLLNCLVDLLKRDKRVVYIDTELDTPLFIMRLLSHLTQIEFSKIRDGVYSQDDEKRIEKAIAWVKSKNFTHEYLPVVDDDKLISIAKRYKYQYGLDVVILDYLKGNGDYFLDAYKNSASLGKTTDTLKNYIAGEMGLFTISAVQATSTGAIADSQKIIRNCSSLLYLERKTPQQIEQDGGLEYGNMTLNVRANRNGEIMAEGEGISLTLDGNRCTFTESKQPKKVQPY